MRKYTQDVFVSEKAEHHYDPIGWDIKPSLDGMVKNRQDI